MLAPPEVLFGRPPSLPVEWVSESTAVVVQAAKESTATLPTLHSAVANRVIFIMLTAPISKNYAPPLPVADAQRSLDVRGHAKLQASSGETLSSH